MVNENPLLIKIDALIQEGIKVSKTKSMHPIHSPDEIAPILFFAWGGDVVQFMLDNFGSKNVYVQMFLTKVMEDAEKYPPHAYHATLGITTLQRLKKYLIENPEFAINKNKNALESIKRIYSNFQKVSVILANRKHHRAPFVIENEYDVQDLLHVFLVISFNDIRREIWTPEYCGGANKVDFLLKDEKIVIETKITSERHQAKEIGDELIKDVAHYREIDECNILSCFIYDPEFYIDNPSGFISDVEKLSDKKMRVFVDIIPLR